MRRLLLALPTLLSLSSPSHAQLFQCAPGICPWAIFTGFASAIATPTQTLDGTATGTSHASTTVTSAGLTTAGTNDILVAYVFNNRTAAQASATSVSGITDSSTLTWARRGSACSFQSGAAGTPFITAEIWWALAPTAQASNVLTITFSAVTDNAIVIVSGVTGSKTATPFDTNASLPKCVTSSATTAPTATAVSTTCNHTFMLAGTTSANTASDPGTQTIGNSPAMFTAISLNNLAAAGINFLRGANEYLANSSAQSSVSPGFSTSWAGWAILVDALQATTC